jgi:N-acetylglucosamine kinase-like BadF-type ATPase
MTKLLYPHICKGPRITDHAEIAEALRRLTHTNERALRRAGKSPEEIAEIMAKIERDFLA